MKSISRFALTALACGSFALLAGCNPNKPTAQTAETAQSTAPSASVAQLVGDATPAAEAADNKPVDNTAGAIASGYKPPTAAQLISLLAPVAVFPDKLVAQVLAASSYPDQITQANVWLSQNSSLKGDALQQAIDKQDWDPSVKAIAVFPDVLHQMANNIPWTTALGEAYVNDPNDVMNAIQALRAQALACNNLKSDKYITVTKTAKNVAPATTQYVDEAPVYSGPPVIPPPEEIVEIEPAQPDYVYVPYFNPISYYGVPIDVWPGYYYAWPAPVYYGPIFSFSIGFWIGGHHHWGWGWDRWDLNWGRGFDRHWGDRGWRNSSVVFNNQPYISRSTTVINRFDPATRFTGGRTAFDPGARTAATFRPTVAGAGFAPRTAATDFNRITAPQFTSTMVQRSAAAPMRANFAPGRTATTDPRPGGLTSAGFAPTSMSRPAQTFDRPGALPSSRYAPSASRAGFDSAARPGFAARDSVRPPSSGYAPPSRQAFAGDAYRAPSTSRNYASAPAMQRSYTSAPTMSRGYASPPRSYAPPPSMRGPAPMASRSFASAPRMQAPHYSAPRVSSGGGGGGRGSPNDRHR